MDDVEEATEDPQDTRVGLDVIVDDVIEEAVKDTLLSETKINVRSGEMGMEDNNGHKQDD